MVYLLHVCEILQKHERFYVHMKVLTLLVKSQKTLGTTTNLKCFSSSAQRSEFLPSFSKSSSWANVPFKSYEHYWKHKGKRILIYSENMRTLVLSFILQFIFSIHNNICMFHLSFAKEDKLPIKHILSTPPDCQC